MRKGEKALKSKGVQILSILSESIAEEIGIEAGDVLLTINKTAVTDILEYKYLITDEYLELEIVKKDGECWIYEVEKDYDDDLGLVFDGLIDEPKSCHNKCIFCFIDQMPKGMRETLYYKDDDTRLSFLQGNFVTLTNLTDKDIDKIIKYRISPINVSVHTTNVELRKKMLNNKKAGKILEYLKKLQQGGIAVKAQLVLIPNINDDETLEKTLTDLSEFYPELECVAAVPVGLTKYRDGLYPLEPYTVEKAAKVIDEVEKMQQYFLQKISTRFTFLSDEFYIIANREVPAYNDYEGFPQLENGVGLITLFREEIAESLARISDFEHRKRQVTIVTGEYATAYMNEAASKIREKINDISIEIKTIKNEFWGEHVKVSGLLTAGDIMNQLKKSEFYTNLFIPESMLKSGETVFLDDITVHDIEKELNVTITVCKEDGSDLVTNILNL